MTWRWPATCSACAFVSTQLGSPTPCPSHVGRWSACTSVADPDEPFTFATALPTADRPWPFTSREYGRLLALRSRVGDMRQTGAERRLPL
jgi:hypothetical protein